MATQCPQKNSLVDFLLGKLDHQAREQLEAHLSDCDPCIDTVRSLEIHDTLNELARDAVDHELHADVLDQPSDSRILSGLIQRLERLPDAVRDTCDPSTADRRSLARSSRSNVQDRAAEVQRLLEPPLRSGDLGSLGRYRIRQLLGAGSSGVVYLADDVALDRPVALKILRPSLGGDARTRFIAEAQATAKLAHENVVSIFDVGLEGPLAYIAMQWLPGETLETRLNREPSLSNDEVIALGIAIASGLETAHQQGLIHRDIKPANIWIPEGDASPRILDFGLVRVTDEQPQLTCTGMIAGTPCYMSPEQSRGEPLDCRSDLFSLGCLLYQCSTGVLPFHQDNALATLQAIQRQQPTHPSGLDPSIPGSLGNLILMLLEKSRHRRPQSAQQIVDWLNIPLEQWTEVASYPIDLANDAMTTNHDGNRKRPFTSWIASGGGRWLAATLMMAALGVAGFLYGPQIIRIATNQGEIVIDSKVDDVTIEVLRGGQRVKLLDNVTHQSIDIAAGEYRLRPLGNDNSISIDRDTLTLKRGEQVIVKVTQVIDPSKQAGVAHFEPDANSSSIANTPATTSPGKVVPLVGPGDTLAIFIEGIHGSSADKIMPIINGPHGPVVGYPIQVDEHGMLALPYIKELKVVGMTCSEIRKLVRATYTSGEAPVLTESAWVRVSYLKGAHELILDPPFSISNTPTPQTGLPDLEQRTSPEPSVRDSGRRPPPQGSMNTLSIDPPVDTKTTPQYQGRSLDEWIQVAAVERDIKQVESAIRGIVTLGKGKQQSQFVEPVFPTMRYSFDLEPRTDKTRLANTFDKFMSMLSLDHLAAGIGQEFELGNRTSTSRILNYLKSSRFQTQVAEHLARFSEDEQAQERQRLANLMFDALSSKPGRPDIDFTAAAGICQISDALRRPVEGEGLAFLLQNYQRLGRTSGWKILGPVLAKSAPETLAKEFADALRQLKQQEGFIGFRQTAEGSDRIRWSSSISISPTQVQMPRILMQSGGISVLPMKHRKPVIEACLDLWKSIRQRTTDKFEFAEWSNWTMCLALEELIPPKYSASLKQIRERNYKRALEEQNQSLQLKDPASSKTSVNLIDDQTFQSIAKIVNQSLDSLDSLDSPN